MVVASELGAASSGELKSPPFVAASTTGPPAGVVSTGSASLLQPTRSAERSIAGKMWSSARSSRIICESPVYVDFKGRSLVGLDLPAYAGVSALDPSQRSFSIQVASSSGR